MITKASTRSEAKSFFTCPLRQYLADIRIYVSWVLIKLALQAALDRSQIHGIAHHLAVARSIRVKDWGGEQGCLWLLHDLHIQPYRLLHFQKKRDVACADAALDGV